MDVVLGVAVSGRVARLAMIGSPASGGQLLDQYALDLSDGAMTDLADTIVGTYREVAETGNRVAAIRLCSADASQAETLRHTVLGAGVENVEVVAEAEAATAVARTVGADAALLLAGDNTVSLTRVGDDPESTSVLASMPIGAAGAAAASAQVLQSLPGADTSRIALVGQRLDLDSIAAELSSTAPLVLPPDAGYAIARGAAQTASAAGFPAGAATMMAPAAATDATQMAPAAMDATQMASVAADSTQMAPVAADSTQMSPSTDPAAVGPQLAYSQEEPEPYELPFESLEEFVPELEDEQAYTATIAPPPPKTVLMGSAFAFVVAAFATLAVSVAVTIRPVADVAAQPAPALQPQTVPGRFLPEVPHAPDPVALPVAVVSPPPAAPAVNVPVNRGPNPVVPPPVQLPAPAPAVPVVPVPGVPVVPVPALPTAPFPTFNPFPTIPTFTTTVTTPVTPTTPSTTTTPTTTPSTTTPTTTPSTPTTTPSTTTSTPTTTRTTTPTTTPPPTTTTTVEPTTTVPTTTVEPTSTVPTSTPRPVTTTAPTVAPEPEEPVTQEPAYTPPAEPAYTAPETVAPEPVVPEVPSSGGEGGFEVPVTTVPLSP
ncbi:hypothetical protein ACN27E_13525 [Mycobacterium sp. WMMD1722]|uniref:hypothetical protein n=1 Tax=Mycobacterium sp. WMMD1722 TaxID=3404117 RepID=UPI003BF608EA